MNHKDALSILSITQSHVTPEDIKLAYRRAAAKFHPDCNPAGLEMNDTFGPVIHAYTRQQAIKDGALFNVSELAKEYGYGIPVAVTCAVWGYCMVNDAVLSEKGAARHAQWNTIDILMALTNAVQLAGQSGPTLLFKAALTICKNGARNNQWVNLKAIISGGDDGEPVLTVMFPSED